MPLRLWCGRAIWGQGSRLTLGRCGRGSPLVWPLKWGPTVMYAWNTGRSRITSSSPKVVAIWRWVDVCLKTVMLPREQGLSGQPALGPWPTEVPGRGRGHTGLVGQPLGVSVVGHLVLRNHDFVLEGGWPESWGQEQGMASPPAGQALWVGAVATGRAGLPGLTHR